MNSNSNTTKQPSKFRRFLRNNAALLLLIFCVLAIAAVILAVTLTQEASPITDDNPVAGTPDDNKPDDVKPSENPGGNQPSAPTTQKVDVHFAKPVDYSEIGLNFTFGPDNLFVFKATLNEWSTHNAVDLKAEEGAEVTAMYDGTVIKTGKTFLNGYYVVVDHGDNVVATYASIKDVEVNVGENVKQGDVLGYVSTTAESEYKEGPHLHLEVAENGKQVDPMPYVNGEKFRTVEVAVKN